jgi:hypothetical protein
MKAFNPFALLFLLFSHNTQALSPSVSTILLGSIQFNYSLQEIDIPIFYKGQWYTAKIESNGDLRKAHFELYEEEKPNQLYIVFTEYIEQPQDINFEHLKTSRHHTYRFFKLTKELTAESLHSTWIIEELESSIQTRPLPDNTIIMFINPQLIEKLHPITWPRDSNLIRLPMVKIHEAISKTALYEMINKVQLALIDLNLFHKKAHLASVPYANNRLLSMPFSSRKIRV